MNERIAVYPGSFDPLTNGHLDILARARRLADRVIVAILDQDQKTPLFSADDRMGMRADHVRDLEGARGEALDLEGALRVVRDRRAELVAQDQDEGGAGKDRDRTGHDHARQVSLAAQQRRIEQQREGLDRRRH